MATRVDEGIASAQLKMTWGIVAWASSSSALTYKEFVSPPPLLPLASPNLREGRPVWPDESKLQINENSESPRFLLGEARGRIENYATLSPS